VCVVWCPACWSVRISRWWYGRRPSVNGRFISPHHHLLVCSDQQGTCIPKAAQPAAHKGCLTLLRALSGMHCCKPTALSVV
jgi:hypothetical protein